MLWRCPRLGGSGIVILQACDVILVQQIAELNLDENQRCFTGVVYPVLGVAWNVEVMSRFDTDLVVADRGFACSRNDHPMLRAVLMRLQGEAVARLDLYAFGGEAGADVDHAPAAPRPVILISDRIANGILAFGRHGRSLSVTLKREPGNALPKGTARSKPKRAHV